MTGMNGELVCTPNAAFCTVFQAINSCRRLPFKNRRRTIVDIKDGTYTTGAGQLGAGEGYP